MLNELSAILTRDLSTLERELEVYPDDASIWRLVPGVRNSAGTLALHLCGNLQHFVGAVLGGTGFQRRRDAEFSTRDVPRDQLCADVRGTRDTVRAVLGSLPPASLDAPYPLEIGEHRIQTGDFLLHLATHLTFHVGQVDYHRRILTGDDRSVSPVSIAELSTATSTE